MFLFLYVKLSDDQDQFLNSWLITARCKSTLWHMKANFQHLSFFFFLNKCVMPARTTLSGQEICNGS